jgi:hypothetical protein
MPCFGNVSSAQARYPFRKKIYARVWSESRMRRTLCLFFILLFWLGPFMTLIPASAESRLPPCCRRQGSHHCSMHGAVDSRAAYAFSGSTPEVTTPAHCSRYPGSTVTSTGPVEALVVPPVYLPVMFSKAHPPAAIRAAARLSELRTRANRGPPSLNFG